MNAITKQDEPRQIVQHGRADQLLGQIIEAARDPNIDAGKMEQMARLAMDLQDRERKTEFNRDLAAALIEMPRISKNGVIVIPAKDGRPARQQGTYAKYEDLDRVVKPTLARHNLVLRFRAGSDGALTTITPILTHTNGHTEMGDPVKFPADTSGSKNAAQAVVSAISYAKRAAATATLNLVFEGTDTDGYPASFVPSDPLVDWQARALEGAQVAASQGKETYEKWFEAEPPKVRNWLVRSGHHARFGGANPALPSPPEPEATAVEPARPDADQKDAAPVGNQDSADAPAPPSGRKRVTPRDYANMVKANVDTCPNADSLDDYLDSERDNMARLATAHPELWQEITDHARLRRQAIDDGRLV